MNLHWIDWIIGGGKYWDFASYRGICEALHEKCGRFSGCESLRRKIFVNRFRMGRRYCHSIVCRPMANILRNRFRRIMVDLESSYRFKGPVAQLVRAIDS